VNKKLSDLVYHEVEASGEIVVREYAFQKSIVKEKRGSSYTISFGKKQKKGTSNDHNSQTKYKRRNRKWGEEKHPSPDWGGQF
jgi:hypothetical protein